MAECSAQRQMAAKIQLELVSIPLMHIIEQRVRVIRPALLVSL